MKQRYWILATLLSHWRWHPSQLATVVTGLAVATALWCGVQAINTHARASYDRAASIFGGPRPATLISNDGPTFAQDLYIKLRRAGWKVSPVLEGRVVIGARPFQIVGIDIVTLPQHAGFSSVRQGDAGLAQFLTPPWQTLAAAETLKALGAAPGARLVTDRGRTLAPLVAASELAPDTLIVDIGVAQDLLDAPGRVSRLIMSPGAEIAAPPLATIVGDQLRLVAPDDESDLARLTDSFHLNLTAFGFLAFIVGLFIVHSAIGLAFEQRLGMMRTVRALGVSSRTLTAMLLVELMSFSIFAGAVGVVCGYLIASALLPDVAASLEGLYGARVAGALTLDGAWWLSGLGMAVLGALAAAGGSLLKVYRLPLLESAQPYAWQDAQRRWLRRQGLVALLCLASAVGAYVLGSGLIAGFAMMAGLLLCAALGLPIVLSAFLRLGEQRSREPLAKWFWADSRQQLSGLSLALMALLLALAANIGVGTMVEGFRKTFTSWLDRRLVAEVYFDAKSNEQARPILRWLEARGEVDAILPVWRAETRIAGWPTDVFGSRDHETYRRNWELISALPDAWDRVRAGDAALISEQTARRLGADVGSSVQIPVADTPWSVTVAGIYADYGNPKSQLRVDSEALLRHWPDVQRTNYALRIAPEKVAGLISAMRAELGGDINRLVDQANLKSMSKGIFEQTFAVTAALNTLTLGVAGIALFASLLTLSNLRLAQLAPVWAMGITRRRLAQIEIGKILLLTVFTAIAALPVGLAVAWCLVAVVNVAAFGWRLPLHLFPVQWVQLFGLALLTALVASLPPIIRLGRTTPAELIKVFVNER